MSTGIHAGPLLPAGSDDEHHVGPLVPAPDGSEHHAGPLTATTHPQRVRRTWREKRWQRRRRRRVMEEVMGWILVPVIVISGIWAVKAGLAAMGTNVTALIQGIRTAVTAGKS